MISWTFVALAFLVAFSSLAADAAAVPANAAGEYFKHLGVHQLCAGLNDSDPPALPSPTDKDGVVKLLSDSFEYCSIVIPNLTDEQLNKTHNSPDGRLPGRKVLLAIYVHVAHHRGQAEICLQDKGIRPLRRTEFDRRVLTRMPRSLGLQGLSEALQILRAHANDAATRAVNVRDEKKRDGQNKR